MQILHDLVRTIKGTLYVVSNPLSNEYKVFLDTLVCCITRCARERLITKLFYKYEGTNENKTSIWHSAINGANYPTTWRIDLSNTTIFSYFIHKTGSGISYSIDTTRAFILLRDVVMHSADFSVS
jgi:hypothetical protein